MSVQFQHFHQLLYPTVIYLMSQPSCYLLGRSGVSRSLQLHPLPDILLCNVFMGNHHPEEADVVVVAAVAVVVGL